MTGQSGNEAGCNIATQIPRYRNFRVDFFLSLIGEITFASKDEQYYRVNQKGVNIFKY